MLIYKQLRAFVGLSFLVAFISSFSVYANELEGVRVWPSPDETRVVIDLKAEADYSYFTLSSPGRLVVDLKQTTLNTKLPINVPDSAVLKKVRKSSPPNKNTYRLVFELKSNVTAKFFKLSPTPGGQYGHRLVIDLPHSNVSPVKPKPVIQPKANDTASKHASSLRGSADIIVAIDPGHGGEDPGSIGPSRKYEKHTTMTVSNKLAAELNKVPGIKAVLTRKGDYFVNLNKRSEIARKNKAHLLVSIHADSFRSPQPRGGSVFVLNMRRANSEIARWVEKHEEQSELLGGAGEVLSRVGDDKNVSQTLLDLKFSHSQKEGYKVATNILKEMGKVTRLHKKDPVHASLAVLKSPDIPSVLVETGFISNPTEEKLLFQRSHQQKLANALAKAIVDYFEENPPEGTLLANRGEEIKHKVKRGEYLGKIASQYGVTANSIKNANKLKSDGLAVGQVLIIPNGSVTSNSTVSTQVITHTVKSGEYLGKIASKYKVSVSSIQKQNNLKTSTLKVGQKLKISVKVKDKPLVKHKVARGEYLGEISSKYGVTNAALRKVNNLKSDQLAIGQILIIPSK
ncbi:N-acetylmuramoyl-L-alanine amidase [Vibrio tapetis]|uniref:N-acetylmuramoyl-L-alanine amidase n=1 Tax=Vibrio tapetis subsp. tapetis TaxID=1671868 RepID=A0A2N8ZFT9_9VIBR|nr:N-acetylmuramoyl-L-alanine amidase [Vibrio tapetis]SON50782.1 putative N-acetylmuramoyl-L-alanine amidase [Vibrio tapetis subsp. tapetis]